MTAEIQNIYDEANSLGYAPYLFDTEVMKYHGVFNNVNGKPCNLNKEKFKLVSTMILRDLKNERYN